MVALQDVIDRAGRRGLVERVPSPADRRAVLVRLTDEGRSLVSHVSALFELDVSRMVECLPVSDRDACPGSSAELSSHTPPTKESICSPPSKRHDRH